MLARVLAVAAAFYLVGGALMLLQRRHPAGTPTSWIKFASFGLLLCGLLAVTHASAGAFAVLVVAAIAAATVEIGRAAGLRGPARIALAGASVGLAVAALVFGADGMYRVAAGLAAGAVLAGALAREPREAAHRAAWGAVGLVAIAVPAAHLLLLAPRPDRFTTFAFLFLVVCSTDAFAELVGRRWPVGRGVLPASPNKSVGGFAGGIAGGVTMAVVLAGVTHRWSPATAALLGAAVAVAAVAGDLIASSVKRAHGIKDFGAALSVHGGVLDRFDSLFFAAWPYYWLVQR